MKEKETFELAIVRGYGLMDIVHEVENYGICANNSDMFYFIKGGWRGFVPREGVLYFGRQDLYC